MALDTFLLVAAQYADEQDALADYDAVKAVYHDEDIIDTFDAAVVSKDADGKVTIVKRHEQPTRDAAKGGLGVGLAVGALVALFPPIALGAGLVVGGAAGAGLGALAGHAAGGLRKEDLKELGDLLQAGQSGFVLVAASDMRAHLLKAITRAQKTMEKDLKSDADELRREIEKSG